MLKAKWLLMLVALCSFNGALWPAALSVWAPNAGNVQIVKFDAADNPTTNVWNMTKSGEWWSGNATLADGDRYRFRITRNGTTFYKADPYGRQMIHNAASTIYKNPSAFTWTDSTWKPPYFEDMVIYELHLGTFIGKNDGLTYPGSFVRMTNKLAYIKSLGCNTIEFLPLNEVPGPFGNTPYLGYNPSTFFAIEGAYGSAEGKAYSELKMLINECHKQGLAVIVDVVYNHVGTSDAAGSTFLWDFDGTDANGGGIYFKNGLWTDWGPAPDWGVPNVNKYVKDATVYWYNEMHVDGLRWDFTSEIKNKNNGAGSDAMRDIVWNLRQINPSKIVTCENHPYENWIVTTGNFNSCWFVDFHHVVEKYLGGQDNYKKGQGPLNLWDIEYAFNGGNYPAVFARTVYSIGHDEARNGGQYNASQFGGRNNWFSQSKSKIMGALQFFVPGIPMMFQGEEFLHEGWFNDDFDHAVNWTWKGDTLGQKMIQMYKDCIGVRKAYPNLSRGGFTRTHMNQNDNVYAYKRSGASGPEMLVVTHLADGSWANYNYWLNTGGGKWEQVFCSQDPGYPGGWANSGNPYQQFQSDANGGIWIRMPAYGVMVFKRVG